MDPRTRETQRLPDLAPRRYDPGLADDRPRREGSRRDVDDPRGGWRRRAPGSPIDGGDDDIDLPSFMRRPRE